MWRNFGRLLLDATCFATFCGSATRPRFGGYMEKKSALYCRVSTGHQSTGLEAQVRALRDYCTRYELALTASHPYGELGLGA
jgi:hypothetical protein